MRVGQAYQEQSYSEREPPVGTYIERDKGKDRLAWRWSQMWHFGDLIRAVGL